MNKQLLVLLLIGTLFTYVNSQCNPNCLTCSGPGPFQCTSCEDGRSLVGGQCIQCFRTCLTCFRQGVNGCVTCRPGFVLDENNACVPEEGCDPSCLTCSGPSANECTSCRIGFFLQAGQCLACDPSCRTCSGPAPNQCLTCNSGFTLVNGQCVPGGSGSQCIDCPFYQYNDPVSGCTNCQYPCQTCIQTANRCQTCIPGFYLYNNKCYPCNRNCAQCVNSANFCIACREGLVLKNYQCLVPRLVPVCHVRDCLLCDPENKQKCLKCKPYYDLNAAQNQCIAKQSQANNANVVYKN